MPDFVNQYCQKFVIMLREVDHLIRKNNDTIGQGKGIGIDFSPTFSKHNSKGDIGMTFNQPGEPVSETDLDGSIQLGGF